MHHKVPMKTNKKLYSTSKSLALCHLQKAVYRLALTFVKIEGKAISENEHKQMTHDWPISCILAYPCLWDRQTTNGN